MRRFRPHPVISRALAACNARSGACANSVRPIRCGHVHAPAAGHKHHPRPVDRSADWAVKVPCWRQSAMGRSELRRRNMGDGGPDAQGGFHRSELRLLQLCAGLDGEGPSGLLGLCVVSHPGAGDRAAGREAGLGWLGGRGRCLSGVCEWQAAGQLREISSSGVRPGASAGRL